MNTTTSVYLDEPDERRTIEMAKRWWPPCREVTDPKTGEQVPHPGIRCLNTFADRGDANQRMIDSALEYVGEALAWYASDGPFEAIPEDHPMHRMVTENTEAARADLTVLQGLLEQARKLTHPRVDRHAGV